MARAKRRKRRAATSPRPTATSRAEPAAAAGGDAPASGEDVSTGATGAVDRTRPVLVVVVVATLSAFAIAPGLWLPHPFFTPIPVLGDGVPQVLHGPMLVALIGLLLPVPFVAEAWRRRLLAAWCALFFVRTALDRATWQPYFFQYSFLLLALAVERGRRALDIARLVFVATYFWAGLSKINGTFVKFGIEAVFRPIESWFPVGLLIEAGYLVPVVEMLAGPLLLWRRTRRFAAAVIVAMHGLTLVNIGPFGLDDQHIIWPWNAASAVLVLLLFTRFKDPCVRRVLWPGRSLVHAVVAALFGVAPALGYVGAWDPYLALKLYSYRTYEAYLDVAPGLFEELPERSRDALDKLAANHGNVRRVRVAAWIHGELRAFQSPARANFLHVGRRVCTLAPYPSAAVLTVVEPPHWRTGEMPRQQYVCDEIPP